MLSLFLALSLAAPPMTQTDAEKLARTKWFEFELRGVKDWVTFVKDKEAKEKVLLEDGRKHRSVRDGPLDDDGLRAVRVLREEFELVAQPREEEIRALARTVLEAFVRGDTDAVATDCAMYDAKAPDRLELTRTYLRENRVALQKAASLAMIEGQAVVGVSSFESPAPARGMTGRVRISFGPEVVRPKGTPSDRFPERHELELVWSGEVMPEANGPLRAAPTTPRPPSRWRFHRLITPYSQQPVFLQ